MRTRKLVTIAILSSIAIVLSILESFIPTGIPGVKLGLANAVTMIVLYLYSEKEASLVLLLRIFLVGLIYSGILSISFFLSLVGGLLSLIVMILIYRIKKDSLYFMSVMGSIFHALGQILVAYIYIKDSSIIYYLPFMLALSIPCGIITASVTSLVLKTFKNEIIKPNRILASILGRPRRAVARSRRLPRKTQIRPVASLVQEGRDGSRRFVCRRMQRTLSQFSKTNH